MTYTAFGKGERRGSKGHHYHQMSKEELRLARGGLVDWVPGERGTERGEGQRETGRERGMGRERARERGGEGWSVMNLNWHNHVSTTPPPLTTPPTHSPTTTPHSRAGNFPPYTCTHK